MTCNKQLCSKVVGAIRIITGLAMIAFGVMKFGADAGMQAFVGGAGHKLGLTFLSVGTWFWIAMIGEIVAGLFLVSGCCKLSKIGAILTLIIMVFAVNAAGFGLNAILVSIGALIVLVKGSGAWVLCPASCCKGKCSDGSCAMPGDQQQQQQ